MTTIIRRHASAALIFVLFAGPLAALELALPAGARETVQRVTDPGSYRLPTGIWDAETGLPTERIEGRIVARAWRIEASGLTPLQIMAPLRDQIDAAGYAIVLDCAARTCGGFDFRFATEVLEAPDMYVDLQAYRFLSARGPGGDLISVLTSRSNAAGYVQVIHAAPTGSAPVTVGETARPIAAPPLGDLAQRLERDGHVILSDLSFETGSAELGRGPFASLTDLAAYLNGNPGRQVLLVGHTDATGSLEANIALSRRRAASVARYLTGPLGVAPAQIGSDGVGYLSPVVSNLTPEGREANRRVEAVLISTE